MIVERRKPKCDDVQHKSHVDCLSFRPRASAYEQGDQPPSIKVYIAQFFFICYEMHNIPNTSHKVLEDCATVAGNHPICTVMYLNSCGDRSVDIVTERLVIYDV